MDDLTLVVLVVGPLHSAWVALSTGECVVGHWLTSLVIAMVFMDTITEVMVLMVSMWMVCL